MSVGLAGGRVGGLAGGLADGKADGQADEMIGLAVDGRANRRSVVRARRSGGHGGAIQFEVKYRNILDAHLATHTSRRTSAHTSRRIN